jgi:hypothetical protein
MRARQSEYANLPASNMLHPYGICEIFPGVLMMLIAILIPDFVAPSCLQLLGVYYLHLQGTQGK